jgi:antirestriction protein ArdC
MNQESARFDPYQIVTDLILQHLAHGVVPWRKPWHAKVGRPRNFHTGRAYQGVNVLLLSLHHFASPYWMTFRQAQERGGFVHKGEHGTLVVKYGQYEREVVAEDGTEEKKPTYYLKAYKVFNAVQIEGIEFPGIKAVAPIPAQERLARAEQIAAQMPQRPEIREGRSSRACYRRLTDVVDIPSRATFEIPEDFYLTPFHELVHSTGHESRLNRKSLIEHDGFGGKVYSEEELVAEMGAAFLGTEAQIVRDQHEQSAAYLKGWLDVLKENDHRRWIVRAASQAEHAADFILRRSEIQSTAPVAV